MKKFWEDFRAFAFKGNVIDMAVGVVIGGAFSSIVTSIVGDLIMPVVGYATAGIDFQDLVYKLGDAEIKYGAFIQNIIDFFIVAVCIFITIRLIGKL